jgi:dihydroorotate dehydrogenase
VQSISRLAVTCGFNGIIGTNTTVNRIGLKTKANRIKDAGSGGLSGRPLTRHSTDVVAWIKEAVGDSAAVIGVGGIFNTQDVIDKRNAGADLVQIYTGFVYNGPSMINNIQEAWIK